MANLNPRPPLTDEERHLLTDPAALAAATAKAPVVLADRTVDNLEIRGQSFSKVKWSGVDFRNARIAATRFGQAELDQVSFDACSFEDVAFEQTRLRRCNLQSADIRRLHFSCVSASELVMSACICKQVVIQDSEFQSFEDRASVFANPELRRVRWLAPQWRGTRFEHAQVDDVSMVGGVLGGVTFTEGRGRGLLVQDALVDVLDFVLGTWVALTFGRIHGRSLRLTEVDTTALSLLDCGELVGVAIAGGKVAGLAIDRCPTLGLVSFGKVAIRGLGVSDSFIDGAYWQGCTVTDDSNIERSCLAGLTLTQSQIRALAIRDTQFTVGLRLEGAHVEGLKLERISYAPDLELRTDGLRYGPGERFPTR